MMETDGFNISNGYYFYDQGGWGTTGVYRIVIVQSTVTVRHQGRITTVPGHRGITLYSIDSDFEESFDLYDCDISKIMSREQAKEKYPEYML